MRIKSISIIIPCYNEESTIDHVCKKVMDLKLTCEKELIVVDDCSDDKSKSILRKLEKYSPSNVKMVFHKKNIGKGACIQSALKVTTCEFVIVQDSDLEYDPSEIQRLINFAEKNNGAVVYGSRNKDIQNSYLYKRLFWGSKFLTFLINVFYGQNLTDPWTCYKLIKRELLNTLNLKEKRFGVEIELTTKLSRLGLKIAETSISYNPRSFEEGKKIKMRDGFYAIFLVFKGRII